MTDPIGSGLNLLCFQSHSKRECRWTRPEVAILGADQKERGLWGREWVPIVSLGRRKIELQVHDIHQKPFKRKALVSSDFQIRDSEILRSIRSDPL